MHETDCERQPGAAERELLGQQKGTGAGEHVPPGKQKLCICSKGRTIPLKPPREKQTSPSNMLAVSLRYLKNVGFTWGAA